MIVELVTFRAPHGGDWDHILEGARGTIPKWSANPKLVRKHFLLSEDAQTCAGLYIWPSRADAEHAHNALWQDEVERRTGSRPEFRYFELQMLLDNEAGTVTEWSRTGEKRVSKVG
ncbi:MAG: hypothetical protein KIT85_13425 [Pseudolabrys sp.]|nr:hypothetical protein [Pseudolabrys sp.]MCW5685400.1 hypothetical protein [Pseudolabrys sp.]